MKEKDKGYGEEGKVERKGGENVRDGKKARRGKRGREVKGEWEAFSLLEMGAY